MAAHSSSETGAKVTRHVRLVRQLLRADPERRAVRRLLLGRHRLPAAARARAGRRDSLYRVRDGHARAVDAEATPASTSGAAARSWPIRACADRHRQPGARAVRPRRRGRAAARGALRRGAAKLVLGENISQAAQFVQIGQRRRRHHRALARRWRRRSRRRHVRRDSRRRSTRRSSRPRSSSTAVEATSRSRASSSRS